MFFLVCVCVYPVISGSLSPRPGATSGCGWWVAANKLNKQTRRADEGWPSSLEVGRDANKSSTQKRILLRNVHAESIGPGLIFRYNLINGKGT